MNAVFDGLRVISIIQTEADTVNAFLEEKLSITPSSSNTRRWGDGWCVTRKIAVVSHKAGRRQQQKTEVGSACIQLPGHLRVSEVGWLVCLFLTTCMHVCLGISGYIHKHASP